MPIYEYRCDDCGHQAEVLQKLSEAPLTDCPSCQQPSLVKLVSAAGFQLKGTGWYATDFRGGSSSKPADGKPAEGKAAEGKAANGNGESSSDSKSATDSSAGSAHSCAGACACK